MHDPLKRVVRHRVESFTMHDLPSDRSAAQTSLAAEVVALVGVQLHRPAGAAAESATVATRFVVEGTHAGDLWGIPATGHHVRWDAIMIYRISDGKVVEQWAVEDWVAILSNVGALTSPWRVGDLTSPRHRFRVSRTPDAPGLKHAQNRYKAVRRQSA